MFLRMLNKVNPRIIINKGRKEYENILENPHSKIWIVLSKIIAFLIVVSVWMIFFETVWDNFANYWNQLFILDFFISSVFLIEYGYRLIRAERKIQFILKPLSIIDLLSFLPFFIWLWLKSSFYTLDMLKVLRIVRVLRLLEINSYSPITIWFIKTIKNYGKEYKSIMFLFLTVLIVISTFVFYAEHNVNPTFSSIPKALWWWIVTMTTVWYWDMVPVTALWKTFGVFTIFLWPLLLAVTSSITILVFMDVVELHRAVLEKVCSRCKTVSRSEANYCYKCWTSDFMTDEVKESVEELLWLWKNPNKKKIYQ